MSQCIYAQWVVCCRAYDSTYLVRYKSCSKESNYNHQFQLQFTVFTVFCTMNLIISFVSYFTLITTIVFQHPQWDLQGIPQNPAHWQNVRGGPHTAQLVCLMDPWLLTSPTTFCAPIPLSLGYVVPAFVSCPAHFHLSRRCNSIAETTHAGVRYLTQI